MKLSDIMDTHIKDIYSRSSKGRVRTNVPMKVYATDLGMANSLMLEPMEVPGRWAENLVAKKVEKVTGHNFYRKDVEVIVPDDRTAIQVCYGPRRKNEIENLEVIPFKDYRKVLITKDEYEPDGDPLRIPLWTYLYSDRRSIPRLNENLY